MEEESPVVVAGAVPVEAAASMDADAAAARAAVAAGIHEALQPMLQESARLAAAVETAQASLQDGIADAKKAMIDSGVVQLTTSALAADGAASPSGPPAPRADGPEEDGNATAAGAEDQPAADRSRERAARIAALMGPVEDMMTASPLQAAADRLAALQSRLARVQQRAGQVAHRLATTEHRLGIPPPGVPALVEPAPAARDAGAAAARAGAEAKDAGAEAVGEKAQKHAQDEDREEDHHEEEEQEVHASDGQPGE